jgi:hypothetical protein
LSNHQDPVGEHAAGAESSGLRDRPCRAGGHVGRYRKATLAAVVLSVGLFLAVGLAGASVNYPPDPGGDARGATDLVNVAVIEDPPGTIHIKVDALAARLRSDDQFVFWIDADANPSTGAPGKRGAEIRLLLDGADPSGGSGATHWDGSQFVSQSMPRFGLHFGYSSGPSTGFDKNDLGIGTSFNFWVESIRGDPSANQVDDAPDTGTYAYTIGSGVAPPAPPLDTSPLPPSELVPHEVTKMPRVPVAGKKFFVAVALTESSSGQVVVSGTVRCSAKIGSKLVRGVRGSFTSEGAACTVPVPKGTKGRRLVVTMTVHALDLTLKRIFTFTIH